jgi:uncharacterized membrane protein
MWKNWSYAKKGGVIGFIFSLIPIIWGLQTIFILAPISQPPEFRGFAASFGYLAILIGVVVIFLGVVVGWVVGKIKSRKQNLQ